MSNVLRQLVICVTAIGGLLGLCGAAGAAPILYHDRGLFTLALAGQALAIDGYETYPFENIPLGGRRGDFLYSFDPTMTQPAVVPDDTGGHALGGAPFDVFVGGDSVTLTFQRLVPAVGPGLVAFGVDFFYSPSGPDIPAETYRLGIADGPASGVYTANNAGLDPLGGSFFLGVIAGPDSAFTQVSLFSVQTDPGFLVPAYQVDNLVYAVAIPEPATILLLALAAVALGWFGGGRRDAARIQPDRRWQCSWTHG